MNIEISVVLPSYNVEHVARQTIESLLGQECNDMYEVIWVDDASTDRTAEIITEYALKNAHIRLFRNVANKGRSWSRNYGVEMSKGGIIIFLDSDNVVEPSFIEAHANLHRGKKCVGLGNFSVRHPEYTNNFTRYWNSRSPEVLVNGGKIDPCNIPAKYLCTANCSFPKTDYELIGCSKDELAQADDDYLGYMFTTLGLKIYFVSKAISDHRDPSFHIKNYVKKLFQQGFAYRELAKKDYEIAKISKYRYLTPIRKNTDTTRLLLMKLCTTIVFATKLQSVVYRLIKRLENSKIIKPPFSLYRFVLAYAFYRGYRNKPLELGGE